MKMLHANRTHTHTHQTSCNVKFHPHRTQSFFLAFNIPVKLWIHAQFVYISTVLTIRCSKEHTLTRIRQQIIFRFYFSSSHLFFFLFAFPTDSFSPLLRGSCSWATYNPIHWQVVLHDFDTHKINIIWWISRLCDIEMIECNSRLISVECAPTSKRNQAEGIRIEHLHWNEHTHTRRKGKRERERKYRRNSFICFLLQCQN